MVQIRYKRIAIPAASTAESLVDALAGLGERKRVIRALWPTLDSFTYDVESKYRVMAIKEQEEVCDFDYSLFGDVNTTASAVSKQGDVQRRIELNLPLQRGDGFKVGFNDPGGSPKAGFITLEYEELD